MPTKEQLEEINDELLAENAKLYRTTERMQEMFGELKELIESKVSTPASLATLPPPEQRPSADQIARQVSFETMRQFAPVVERMGEVIETMERSHERAEGKIRRAEEQLTDLKKISDLADEVRRETQSLHSVATYTKESFWDVLAAKWVRILVTVIVAMTVGVLIAAYAFRQVTEPDTLTSEASENWQIYTYDMTPEQKAQLMAEIRAKRAKIIAAQDSSQPAEAGAGQPTSTTTGQSTSAGSPSAAQQSGQQSGKQQPGRARRR